MVEVAEVAVLLVAVVEEGLHPFAKGTKSKDCTRAKERSGSKELFLVITATGRMTLHMTMATKISGHLQPTFDH